MRILLVRKTLFEGWLTADTGADSEGTWSNKHSAFASLTALLGGVVVGMFSKTLAVLFGLGVVGVQVR